VDKSLPVTLISSRRRLAATSRLLYSAEASEQIKSLINAAQYLSCFRAGLAPPIIELGHTTEYGKQRGLYCYCLSLFGGLEPANKRPNQIAACCQLEETTFFGEDLRLCDIHGNRKACELPYRSL
jgi:hypothetical protein